MEGVVIQIRNVPRALRDQFKALAALRGSSVTAEIIKLMQKEVDKHGIK